MRSGRFDIRLKFCGSALDNHILELTMRFYLRQITVSEFVSSTAGIKELEELQWTEAEWAEFRRKFKLTCDFWHRRFCLVPPRSADEFSISDGPIFVSRKYMPNIECHFIYDLVGKAEDAHWPVKVTKAKKGDQSFPSETGPLQGADLSSNDTDPPDKPRKLAGLSVMQIVAAHEIGHMLGQPHVGQIKNTAACVRALKIERDGAPPPDGEDGRYFIGGAGASVCYGWSGNASDLPIAQNIMGLGMSVDGDNAISWRNALAKVVWDRSELPDGWTTVVGAYRNPRLL